MADESLCEVTGKVFPPEDLVVFQGKRVSAEGKAILLERLKGGLATSNELEKPSIWKRFIGMFADGIVVGIIAMLTAGIIMGIVMATVFQGGTEDEVNPSALSSGAIVGQLIATVVASILVILYFGIMHGHNGQTYGKRAMKTKVVMADGSAIDKSTAYKRAFWFLGPNYLCNIAQLSLMLVAGGPSPDPNSMNSAEIVGIAIVMIGAVYSFANAIAPLFDSQQRALHDRFCGTRVVLTQ
jgi:uncharacterized RDD family membrane protein YckC